MVSYINASFRLLAMADKATDNLSLKVLEHLAAAQATLKSNQRKAAISSEVSKFRNASTKRNVRYNRQLLNDVEDMEELFKVDEGEDFINADNIEEANEVIRWFRQLLEGQRQAIQHELNMVVVADASPLKWKTVSQLEGGFELPSCVTIASSEVRKAEKDSMAFTRELNNARNARKRLNQNEGGASSAKFGRGGDRGRRGRGGAVSGGAGRGRTCFKCGDASHYVAQCDK